ncbi:MAG: cyclic nucleotide-binding domain-containing protein [Mariprofundaceae bacterium]
MSKQLATDTNITEWVQQHALFQLLSDDALSQLMSQASFVSLEQGDLLIEEEQGNDALYMLQQGSVRVVMNGTEVATLHRGEVVGEISMSKFSPPIANVIANESIEAISFPAMAIEVACNSSDKFFARLRDIGMQRVYQ